MPGMAWGEDLCSGLGVGAEYAILFQAGTVSSWGSGEGRGGMFGLVDEGAVGRGA